MACTRALDIVFLGHNTQQGKPTMKRGNTKRYFRNRALSTVISLQASKILLMLSNACYCKHDSQCLWEPLSAVNCHFSGHLYCILYCILYCNYCNIVFLLFIHACLFCCLLYPPCYDLKGALKHSSLKTTNAFEVKLDYFKNTLQ